MHTLEGRGGESWEGDEIITERERKKKNLLSLKTYRRVDRLWRVLSGVASLHGRRADVDDDGIDVV